MSLSALRAAPRTNVTISRPSAKAASVPICSARQERVVGRSEQDHADGHGAGHAHQPGDSGQWGKRCRVGGRGVGGAHAPGLEADLAVRVGQALSGASGERAGPTRVVPRRRCPIPRTSRRIVQPIPRMRGRPNGKWRVPPRANPVMFRLGARGQRRRVVRSAGMAGPFMGTVRPTRGRRVADRRLQPAAREAGAAQPRDDVRAPTHDVPDQAGAVVFDHQHHGPLVDAELVLRDPPARGAAGQGERAVE